MTFFAHAGSTIRLIDDSLAIKDAFDNGYYTIEVCPQSGDLYLQRVAPFTLPTVYYGDLERKAERIKSTSRVRDGVTGVLLIGDKGSGKTLLGKKVAFDMQRDDNQPVIILNKPLGGDRLGRFLQRLGRPVTLFLDEFEKVYDAEQQESILTVLDGVYPMKLTVVLTANDGGRIMNPFIDRPGRVFYKLQYHGLGTEFVRDYATAKLNDQSQVGEMTRLALLVELNFDQLQALVEEMNRYGETVSEAIQFLNISMESGDKTYDVVSFELNGKQLPSESVLTRSQYIDLFEDRDEDSDMVVIDVVLPNVDRKTHGKLIENGLVRRGANNYRFERAEWADMTADHVPEEYPLSTYFRGPLTTTVEDGVIYLSPAIPHEGNPRVGLRRVRYDHKKAF